MKILAIDPGTTESGIVAFDGERVGAAGVLENGAVLDLIATADADLLAIEMVASYGMAVGKETFRTVWWAGRFAQAWQRHSGNLPAEVYRQEVKLHLCRSVKAKDANIRQALIDRFGPVGTKANRGALYGVSSHAWAALAVAVTTHDQLQTEARAA